MANHAADVFRVEAEEILSRRRKKYVLPTSEARDSQDVRDLPDTFGLACSGGGIRSAAVSAGVVSALSEAGLFERLDLLAPSLEEVRFSLVLHDSDPTPCASGFFSNYLLVLCRLPSCIACSQTVNRYIII